MSQKKPFPMPKNIEKTHRDNRNVPNMKVMQQFIETGEIKKPEKKQISLGINVDLLSQVDECAKSLGMSRAAYMNAILSLAVQEGLSLGKKVR